MKARQLNRIVRAMQKGGASPFALTRNILNAYTGKGCLVDNFSVVGLKANEQKLKKPSAKNELRVRTESKINSQITKLSRAVERSTEKDFAGRLIKRHEQEVIDHKARRQKAVQVKKDNQRQERLAIIEAVPTL